MLSPKTQHNLANAKSYFEEHLCAGDYYSEEERVRGEWTGAGAAMLGLSGLVQQNDFLTLCENLHPSDGKRLTQRLKTTRRSESGDSEVANRRVFYDFTFSPPKSVSVAALVSGDERITAAHAAAVRIAMAELETFTTTQVHAGRERRDRHTGNVVAALFQHDTSRALDPHLHTHCILFNATHDPVEKRWKALHNYSLLAAQKYVENVYYHQLAQALGSFGYTVVNSARGDFEIAEVSNEVRERFSKRHKEIDEKTRALLANRPEKLEGNVADIREYIAHKSRERKLPALPKERLRDFWRAQLVADECRKLSGSATGTDGPPAMTIETAVSWAEEHLFERRSVVHEHELWRHALSAGRGADFSLAELKAETAKRHYIRSEAGKVSRPDVLAREWQLVELVRDGTCRHTPLAPAELRLAADLAPDQQHAFEKILASADFATLFRGGAGTGKSYVLRRIQAALGTVGHPTVVLAPQRQQVLDLSRDGLENGQTVSEFLQRGTAANGAVVIVDEAGQIGGKQLLDVLQLVQRGGGRVILSGDTRQHGPVEVSDALRAIERYSGLLPAELSEIRRQDPTRATNATESERVMRYREAVQAAADGDGASSFQVLDALGAITECGAGEQAAQLADEFLRLSAKGDLVLVVSQTRAEVREVNDVIRARLIAKGTLRGTEQTISALEPVDLTAAQKADARYYSPEYVAILNRSSRGTPAGSVARIVAATAAGVAVEVGGKLRLIARKDLDRLSICRPRDLALREGDRVQLKANGASADGRKLANGEIVTIAHIEAGGAIRLEDGRIMPPHYRQLARGYAVTSYGSQGKTVDHVLFADSSVRGATSAEQWYVTISRGRKSVRIFTPDKAQLAKSIRRTSERELALDLRQVSAPKGHLREFTMRGLKRGREFARRICMMINRRAVLPRPSVREEIAPAL
jgi:conjugative relaxase-like TrwC/TraI family protein